jgi:hypothetical protein
MITLELLEQIYGRKIPRKFKLKIIKYINRGIIQKLIKRAIDCELTKNEINYIASIGSHNSKEYPYLYWLTRIYINPITKLQFCLDIAEEVLNDNN